MLAGRDLEAGGTWLGCSATGRFAALTNFPTGDPKPNLLSRGNLPADFLKSNLSSEAFAADIQFSAYQGFNLLLFDGNSLVYTSNQLPAADRIQSLSQGYYGLSNAELGATWPKCVNGAAQLARIAQQQGGVEDMLALLRSEVIPPDEELPQRGRDIDFERQVAPCFINADTYGTRASTVVMLSAQALKVIERTFGAAGSTGSESTFVLDLTASSDGR